jgi:Rrf2 family nitric oxide-sensitive transcriptional repressor
MQLTRFTDYALRTLIYLGKNSDRLVTIREIAEQHKLFENHLVKIVHKLAKLGYIETVRGKGGGMRLARRPGLINLGDVVRDTEENMNIAECFEAGATSCTLLPSCVLKSVLIEAKKKFLDTLDLYTISDLINTQPKTSTLKKTSKQAKTIQIIPL